MGWAVREEFLSKREGVLLSFMGWPALWAGRPEFSLLALEVVLFKQDNQQITETRFLI